MIIMILNHNEIIWSFHYFVHYDPGKLLLMGATNFLFTPSAPFAVFSVITCTVTGIVFYR